jgi:sec-independent protein translocase protein TatA
MFGRYRWKRRLESLRNGAGRQSINLNKINNSETMKLDPMLAVFGLGGSELILILGVALLLFGGKKLPELAKGLGQGIKEFKKATSNASEEIRHSLEETLPAAARRLPQAPADTESTTPQVCAGPKSDLASRLNSLPSHSDTMNIKNYRKSNRLSTEPCTGRSYSVCPRLTHARFLPARRIMICLGWMRLYQTILSNSTGTRRAKVLPS